MLTGSLSTLSSSTLPRLLGHGHETTSAFAKSVVGHRPLTGTPAVSIAGRASAAGYLTCSRFLRKSRFALKAALYHAAKHSAVRLTRPVLTVRAYYSTPKYYRSSPVYRCICKAIGWVGWWEGYGCEREGVPNRLRDWPRWFGHERNHQGESCCFFGLRGTGMYLTCPRFTIRVGLP